MRVEPLHNFREIVKEGYFPKLLKADVTKAYPPRLDRSRLYDLNSTAESIVQILDLEQWRDRIHEAIDNGYIIEVVEVILIV